MKWLADALIMLHYVIAYLLLSPFCESDLFENPAKKIVENGQSGYAKMITIIQWVHKNIASIQYPNNNR